MTSREERKKSEAIDTVAGLLRERLPKPEGEHAAEFARLYYGGVGPEDLLPTAAEDLYGAALSHWNLCHRRRAGARLIRVYNPAYEENGWQSTHTVVEIVSDDMPFLVDSVNMVMNRHGLTVHLVIHPVIGVRRNRRGEISAVHPPDAMDEGIGMEAIMRFEVDRQTEIEALDALSAELEKVLSEVLATVEDWQAMRGRLMGIIESLQTEPPPLEAEILSEGLDFLRWVANDHFTFLGCRTYDLVTAQDQDVLRLVSGSGLGILRDDGEEHVSESFAHIAPHLRVMAREKTLLVITKSTARSTVHRPAHMDYVGVKRFDQSGNVLGEWRFLGLYSSLAYSTRPEEIPLLRQKVAHVLKRSNFSPSSHAGKAMQNILDHFPRDEMFQATADELFEIGTGILQVQERHRLRLFLRKDLFGRFVTALIYVPRDRYDTELRLKLQSILMDALEGISSEFNVQFTESVLARVHFIIRTQRDSTIEYDETDLEARMSAAMQSWEDKLHAALLDTHGEAKGNRFSNRYAHAFPVAYRHDFTERTAAIDIERLEALSDGEELLTHLYRPLEGPDNLLRFKVYGHRTQMALSDVLPMLERMGLRVLEARPYEVTPAYGDTFWILDFDMTAAQGSEVDVLQVKDVFQEAFVRVCRNDLENDGFNRLVLSAGLGWRDVVVVRAISKYLLQTQAPFSQAYMESTLANNAPIARLLVDLFHARFDPQRQSTAREATEQLRERVVTALDNVVNLDQDRILRRFLAVILATLRCNFFQQDQDQQSKSYLAFKLDPQQVPELPEPRPMFEIFVYSPRVEGVHLRGGRVARGGLRWSDRREDFRIEVLGLMKAQMVKNSVIVPVGAKGGFVCKQLPDSDNRDDIQAEVVQCYKTFIRGLLDVTDNLVAGEAIPPTRLVRYDADDPYLVVAADKGTATFSDIANGVAKEYGFWLGDAFASGGSVGYDHKQMGITARGAWESVKRLFREQGVDTQRTPFTVVGVGDMSGDVFGNGMLLSDQICLVAAFNHMHIFLDPKPDPGAGFKERKRLFEKTRSSWTDYNKKLISEGGGIFARTAKSITLSPQVQQALGVDSDRMTPNELIRCILKAPVDLLWNGGIGTYVKAASESDQDVGDRTNDAVRVNGRDLRCKVIGEGGNLGLTQLGRVEFDLVAHGLINTDAIDNSAGVDCSDHEVNIKILLDQVVRDGDITLKQRNGLLAEMTDSVAQLVLRHNYLQSQALSISAAARAELIGDQMRLIRALEQSGRLKRAIEFLPNDETLVERENSGSGLSRPETAVLLAYSKIRLYDDLLASDIAEDTYLAGELQDYFPEPLQERYALRMENHPLRREIIVTRIANSLVNRMGSTFCQRIQDVTGHAPADIARAYTVAREVYALRTMWQQIEALDNQIPASEQLEMLSNTIRLVDRCTLWLLRNRRQPMDIAAVVAELGPNVAQVCSGIGGFLRGDTRTAFKRRLRHYSNLGAPESLAANMAGLDALYSALDITDVAVRGELNVSEVAGAYFALGIALDLPWVLMAIRALPRHTQWQNQARSALRDDLFTEMRHLTGHLIRTTPDIRKSDQRVEAWLSNNAAAVERCKRVFAEIQSSPNPDLAMLSVAVRAVRNLVTEEVIPSAD